MTQRTATLTVYDGPGGGATVNATATITFPDKPGYENRIWNPIGGIFGFVMGVHTFRLPFREEVYGMRVTMGIANGPVRTGGMRFDRIEVDLGVAPTIQTDAGNPYLFVTGNKIVIGGDNGAAVRHQLGPRNATRVRFAIGATLDTVIANAKPYRKAFQIAPGIECPYPPDIAVSGGTLASSLAYMFGGAVNAGRQGLSNPMGYLDPGNGVGSGVMLQHLPGWEQNYSVALKRGNGVMDRHGVDCLDYHTGDPLNETQVKHALSSDKTTGYGLGGSEVRGWRNAGGTVASPTRIGGQLSEFWAGNPDVDGNVVAFWHNSTAGTYENYMVYQLFPHDLPHLARTHRNVEALADQWNDPIAQFDIVMVAQDALYLMSRYLVGFDNEGREDKGTGSFSMGARSWSWGMDVLTASREPRHNRIAHRLASAIASVQMVNGACMHQSINPNPSPNPWYGPISPGTLFDATWDEQQVMEMTITACALARNGFVKEAAYWFDMLFVGGVNMGGAAGDLSLYARAGGGYIPKFIATRKAGVVEHRINNFVGGGDFWSWVAIGMGIRISKYSSFYLTAANTLASPLGGVGGSLSGTIALLKSNHATSPSYEQTAIALSSLEFPF